MYDTSRERCEITQLHRAEIPNIVLVISFGRVIWLLEKAGSPPLTTQRRIRTALRCAENIARRWIWEHHERGAFDSGVSFPGDSSLHQSMMPAAIWLGTREYAGVWLHGGERGRFAEREVFGFLGDGRMSVLSEAMRLYGREMGAGTVLSAPWYRNYFMHWAINFMHFWSRYRGELVLTRSRPGQDMLWCEVVGCPYPYVTITQVAAIARQRLDPNVGREVREPVGDLGRSIRPQWGAYLTGERVAARNLNRDGDEIVVEEDRANGT